MLTDGRRTIEIHRLAGNGHNDAFAMVYLPAERILVEVDAWAPLAPNAPPPPSPSPFAINLYENIQKLKLDVRQIAALHGPGVATLADCARPSASQPGRARRASLLGSGVTAGAVARQRRAQWHYVRTGS